MTALPVQSCHQLTQNEKSINIGADMHEIKSIKHRKKMIAPIIITGIVIIYYAFFFGLLITSLENTWLKWLLGIIPILLAATMIFVCVERIKEIKGGEEDDLSQY